MIKNGCTRMVFLIGRYAIKVPQVKHGWRNFLNGLLGNLQERIMDTMKDKRMCPIIWSIPGGWLNVMPRCDSLTQTEFEDLRIDDFWEQTTKQVGTETIYYGPCKVPVEHKRCSFGWYKNRIVAVDYGS